jgi:nitroreductase
MNKINLILTAMLINTQNPDYIKMVEYATMAPSGHNTQPWKFEIEDSVIRIHPDSSCLLPVVDNDNRELYISLGCALENLCIAANEFGYKTNTTVQKNGNAFFINVEPEKEKCIKNPLFAQIERRQTNRNLYNNQIIHHDTIEILKRVPSEKNVEWYLYEKGDKTFGQLTEYIIQGNEIQMNDKNFKKELLSWMRYNDKQVANEYNGLSCKMFNSPSMPKSIGKFVVGCFLNPKTQNKTDLEKIESSSHLVLVTTTDNTPEGWIATGQSLERFLLATTELGIACAYHNQPCEVKTLAQKLQNELLEDNEFPMLILRIGYAPPAPYSLRKPVDRVIIKAE